MKAPSWRSDGRSLFGGLALSFMLGLGACETSKPVMRSEPLPHKVPPGSTIRLTGLSPLIETPNAKTAGETVAVGTAAGAAAGAGVGAGAGFMLGFACGPFFVVCSPLGAIGGAAGGVIFGAAAGGISEGMLALPKEKAEALEAFLTTVIAEQTSEAALASQFEELSQGAWIVSDKTGPVLTLSTVSLSLIQRKNDLVSFHITNALQVRYEDGSGQESKELRFGYSSETKSVDAWIAEDGAELKSMVEKGVANNVSNMVRLLKQD